MGNTCVFLSFNNSTFLPGRDEYVKKRSIIFFSVVLCLSLMSSSFACWRFAQTGIKNKGKVGTCCPTQVASEMIRMFEWLRCLQPNKAPFYVIEVGAGNGEITLPLIEHICKKKYKDIHICAVEYMSDYFENLKNGCEELEKKYGDCCPAIWLEKGDFLTIDIPFEYCDFLISTVPFNEGSITSKKVKKFLKKFEQLVVPDGVISYVEYRFLGDLKWWLPWECDFRKKYEILKNFRERHFCINERKNWHFPPIHLYHMINNVNNDSNDDKGSNDQGLAHQEIEKKQQTQKIVDGSSEDTVQQDVPPLLDE